MATVEDSILSSIQKNGYPAKRVSLPFQAIFNTCKNNNVSLTSVLKNLEAQNVLNEISNDKILFYHKDFKNKAPDKEKPDIPENLVAEAMKKIKEINPADLEEMEKKVMEMSPEERNELMKHAKNMFRPKSD